MGDRELDDLKDRVKDLESGNGWHEYGKHVLKELERLNRSQERIEKDNREGHKGIYDKLDEQKQADENRLIACNNRFLPSKTFHWLVIALLVVFGSVGTMLWANNTSLSKLEVVHTSVSVEKVHGHTTPVEDLTESLTEN